MLNNFPDNTFRSTAAVIIKAVTIALLCTCATGCLKQDFREDTAVLDTDISSLEVNAAAKEGESELTAVIKVTANRSWRASFVSDDGTTATPDWTEIDRNIHPNLSDASYVTELTLRLKENISRNGRSVTLRLTSRESSKDIRIVQNGAEPYISIDRESTPESVGGGSTECTVKFRTNSDWTAEITDSSFPEIALSQHDGDYETSEIKISFPVNTGGNPRTATISLRVKDSDITDSFLLTQNPGLSIALDLTSDKPFSDIDLPAASASSITSATTAHFSIGEKVYETEITPAGGKGFYHGGKSGQRYLIFTGPGSISAPAIDGYRLATLTVIAASASNRSFSITKDADGTITAKGGEKISLAAGEHCWSLEDTAAGAPYYLYCGTANPRIQRLIFFYE